ncbi:MAG: ABC transporter ATP-binding protein [Cellulomonas iranensis]|uniref:ABC transporter ATP-binding protein n=1 Tax=Cellulomonas iranensis TaxID=76862 RepID=UPI001B0D143D|nr:ABC transporter ATP-binding protein [Cellulomonas iranensis]MBO9568317.1 ABC transporter ATP-binding protein [Cellulomonas iranensis]
MSAATATPARTAPGATTLPVADPAATRRYAWQVLRAHRGGVAAAAVVLLAGAFAGLVPVWLVGRMVDAVASDAAPSRLWWSAAALVGALVGATALAAVARLLVARTFEHALADLRERTVHAALHAPAAHVDGAGTGDLVARVSGDVDVLRTTVSRVLPAVCGAGATILLTVGGLAGLDWRFAVAVLAAVPLQVWGVRTFGRRAGPVFRAERAAAAERTSRVLEAVAAADTIRALGTAETHVHGVEEVSHRAIDRTVAGMRVSLVLTHRLHAAELVALGAVLVAGYGLVGAGAVTVGAATTAALLVHRLFDPVGILLSQVDDLQRAQAALARVVGVLSVPAPAGADAGGAGAEGAGSPAGHATTVPDDRAAATVDVRGVSFAYDPDRPVLHDVDLRVEAGEVVALVGASGAGKSTLARLVTGTVTPTAGTVLVEGEPAGGPRASAAVAAVTQEVHVFAGTLADDLRLARPDADDARLRAALALVGADWVDDLPEGLRTAVGAGGLPLAPDRAQQVALARLALTDARVVVLDEATAEAGSDAARTLDAAARRVLAGRTALVVVHRLDQAARADRIVLLDAGRVVATGTHDELLAGCEPYARLWSAWHRGRTS